MGKRGRPRSQAWQPTAIACERLGISRWSLARARKGKILKRGYHWRLKNPTAAKPHYLWHIERLEQWQCDEDSIALGESFRLN